MVIVSKIKKEISKFLLGEEGKIAKESILKLGPFVLLASVFSLGNAEAHVNYSPDGLKGSGSDPALCSHCYFQDGDCSGSCLNDCAVLDAGKVRAAVLYADNNLGYTTVLQPPQGCIGNYVHGSCGDHISDGGGCLDNHFSCSDHLNSNENSVWTGAHNNAIDINAAATTITANHTHFMSSAHFRNPDGSHMDWTAHANDHADCFRRNNHLSG